MGFKPRSAIKRHYYMQPAQFLFPDENVVRGSTSLFAALLKRCLAREVVAICRYIPRKNTPPVFVALMPQVSKVIGITYIKERSQNNTTFSSLPTHTCYLHVVPCHTSGQYSCNWIKNKPVWLLTAQADKLLFLKVE